MEENMLNEIKNFNKTLKKTTTTVRTNTYINVEGEKSGHGHSKDSDNIEYFDPVDSVKEKVKKLAELIKNSKKK